VKAVANEIDADDEDRLVAISDEKVCVPDQVQGNARIELKKF
jgi:hypothetical protein